MSNQVIWPGRAGTEVEQFTKLTQASTLETITINAIYRDGTTIDLSSYIMTGTRRSVYDDSIVSLSGTLTPGNGSFTWKPSETDVGASGSFYLKFVYTDGSDRWESEETFVEIEGSHAVDAIAGSELLGVSAAEAALLTALETSISGADEHDVAVVDGSGNLAFTSQPRGFLMQRTAIDAGETVTIPALHQMIVAENLQVDGALVADGDLHIV